MITIYISIILNLLALGLIYWLKKEQQMDNSLHEAELQHTHQGMNAMMEDFNNYQVETDRKITQLEKNLEYQNNKFNKRIDRNEKELPSVIGRVVKENITPILHVVEKNYGPIEYRK